MTRAPHDRRDRCGLIVKERCGETKLVSPLRFIRPERGVSAAIVAIGRFFWFFCGLKRRSNATDKSSATTEKSAGRAATKTEARPPLRLPICLLQEL
jgi:hypothetical protein